MHIISKVDGKTFKIILVDVGSTINIISTTTYKNLNLPFSCSYVPFEQYKSFNDALCSIVGSILLPIIVETKIVQIMLQEIEGDIT